MVSYLYLIVNVLYNVFLSGQYWVQGVALSGSENAAFGVHNKRQRDSEAGMT